jgi:tRNA(adenine34) deaminase
MNSMSENYTTDETSFMHEALREAEIAASIGEIPVGAVIICNGAIIARGHNTNRTENNPTRHAEIIAIESACQSLSNERLDGCTLFVTKEPCAMCAGAIIHSRIREVVIGTRDDKYGACGTVFDILGNTGFNHVPVIRFGLLGEEAVIMLKSFFAALRESKKATE